jgi:diguanylate cyclase (GGDEF)-like protein/PAS domain S-box-containing protein
MSLWGSIKHSLRFRLVFATVAVEAIVLALLLVNSMRLMENSMLEQTRTRLKVLDTLLSISLSTPLAQMDYGTTQQIIEQSRRDSGVEYLAVFDQNNHLVAISGWPLNQPLPASDNPDNIAKLADPPDHRLDIDTPIQIGNQLYGRLRYGISTQQMVSARERLLLQTVAISVLGVIVSAILLALLGVWLTRHLSALTQASQAVAEGNFDIRLADTAQDETGKLSAAFNAMAEAIRSRIAAIRYNEAKFTAIADYTYDWESWFDPGGKLIWVNPSVMRLTGYTPDECMRMAHFPFPLIVEEDRTNLQTEFEKALQGHPGKDLEFRIQHKNGDHLWVAASWQSIYNKEGEYLGIRSSIRDISERKESELVLREAFAELKHSEEMQRQYLVNVRDEQARLVALLSAMNLGILFVSVDSRVVYYNPAFMRLWKIPEGTPLTGKLATDVLNHSPNVLSRPDHFSKHVLNVLQTHESSESFEIFLANGSVLVQLSYPVRDNEGRLIGRLWIYEDVTHERQTAQQLIYLAERDSLTGLYNRHRFQEELARMLAEADRHRLQGALIFFDLDEFKYINDTFGHRAGDSILIRVAGEVSTLVRRNEIFSRLGGDEFAILVPNVTAEEINAFSERVVRAIAQIPFRFDGQNLRLTCSLGIAFYPQHATNAEELVSHADIAMYQAKEAGKNAWRVYRQDLDSSREMVARLTWNDRINDALENNLLQLHFQGIYHTQSGELSHLEALVRMLDKDNPDSLISPGHFIPVAERSGKILDIDRWVIRECIAILAKSETIPPLAVNISGRSFDEPTLPQYIDALLKQYSVNPSRLYIELTETSAVTDLQDAERFIEALHRTGCVICMDDFGTGFSSFAYLKHLKADVLKIDGLFIRDLPNDRDNQVFVKAIVDVARGMHKITVAEFVENAEILEILKDFGVDLVQGYHLDMPRADHPALRIND